MSGRKANCGEPAAAQPSTVEKLLQNPEVHKIGCMLLTEREFQNICRPGPGCSKSD